MLTRDQLTTLRIHKQFHSDVIGVLSLVTADPKSDIIIALKYAASALKADCIKLDALVKASPRLLLEAGNVVTPAGYEVRGVTIFEFLLGAGDPLLALFIQKYFADIPKGEFERRRQYERYRPHVERISHVIPDANVDAVFTAFIAAPVVDRLKAFRLDKTHTSALQTTLINYQKNRAPHPLRRAGMHYNYGQMLYLLQAINESFAPYHDIHPLTRYGFIWNQLIGFEMRRFTGVDRCMSAQGMWHIMHTANYIFKFDRSYKLNNGSSFPITPSDNELDNNNRSLGRNYSIDFERGTSENLIYPPTNLLGCFSVYLERKKLKYAEIMQPIVQPEEVAGKASRPAQSGNSLFTFFSSMFKSDTTSPSQLKPPRPA